MFRERDDASHWPGAMLSFSPFAARWRVGHDYFLVLAFATTRRHLALRAPRLASMPDAMFFLCKFEFVKPSYTVCHSIASKLKGNPHDGIIFEAYI